MEDISRSFNHPVTEKETGSVDASLQSDEQSKDPPVIYERTNSVPSSGTSAHSDDSKGNENDDNVIFNLGDNSPSKEVCDMDNNENDKTIRRLNSPYEWLKKVVNKDDSINNSGSSEKFHLRISNMPLFWGFPEIKDFLFKEYGPVDYFYMSADEDLCFLGAVELEFTSLDDCHAAYKKLNGKIVEDIKLFAEIKDTGEGAVSEHSDEEAHPTSAKKRKLSHTEPWRPVIDVWDVDPKGLFGLKPEFLETLGIKPPIGRWVHVTNFRCEKFELKEVLELAGQVMICSVDSRGPKYAKVMYSHPLEAVQAVSMLNNQDYYGLPLKVTIDSCLDSGPILPKGLETVGPGLGIDQKPLQDIVKQYERFVNYKSSLVNTAIFLSPDVLFGSNADESQSHDAKQANGAQGTAQSWHQTGVTQSTFNQTPTENQGPTGHTPSRTIQPAPNLAPNVCGTSLSGPTSVLNAQHIIGPTGPIQIRPMPGPAMTSQGPMAGPRPMAGPISAQRPMAGPISAQRPMAGPISGQRLMSGLLAGQRPMAGPISGQGPNVMGLQGYMATPRTASMVSMNFRGHMTSAGPMAGHRPTASGPMGNLWPMANPRAMGFNVPQNTMPNSMAGVMQGPVNPPGPRAANNNATVTLSNLPLSTTFPLLCEKMGQCGSVISLQVTAPGCAIVQFAERASAVRCFQQYNNCNVLGNIIKVMLC